MGALIAGGCEARNKVEVFNPNTKRVCSLPDMPSGERYKTTLCGNLFCTSRSRRDIQHFHWSSSYIAALSLVESFRLLKYFHALKGHIIGALSDATPAVLCHKEPAKIPPTRGISCSSLVLYGIRIVGFHARKGPIRGGFMH